MRKTKKLLAFLLILTFVVSASGCLRTKEASKKTEIKNIDLVYYKMFDDEDALAPVIQKYQAKNPGVRIHYKKFTDFEEYMTTIINELAEGEGPDMFSAQNTWFAGNLKKITPMPTSYATTDDFDQTYVDVASHDLINVDEGGEKRIYGIPLTVDTLAVYYNKDHFSDKVPGAGRPAATWSELEDQVAKLTKADDSYEHFEVAGIAMGRADNITRAVDILYLLMMQVGTAFYNAEMTDANFALAAKEPLEFFTSFATDGDKNYSWNKYISDPESDGQEISAFAKGKVSMIIGYAYVYDQILNEISRLKKDGNSTIAQSVVRVAPIPQMSNDASRKRVAYANYFAETVSRTSKHPEEAWKFLTFIGSKDSLKQYNKYTHKPTSRRDLIDEQKLDPVFGVFVNQIGYAESFPVFDYHKYKQIFTDVIQKALAGGTVAPILKGAESDITKLIPKKKLVLPTKQEDKNETTNGS